MAITKNKTNWFVVLIWIVAVELVGILGSVFTVTNIQSWYQTLEKPWFNPPNWIFGPVWTALYAMIGYVGYRLWRDEKRKKKKQKAKMDRLRGLFILQLILNGIWSPIFFGTHNLLGALITILFLWGVILALMVELFVGKSKLFWWLVPYFLWVSFASVLNFAILVLN